MRLILALLLFLPAGWARPALADTPDSSVSFREWQILDARTGQPVAFEAWLTELAVADVIYLGEEHRNRSHIEAALKILDALLMRNRQLVLAAEMFAWDGQVALDRYLTDRTTPDDRFLQESRWEQNWGGAYDDYAPLVTFALEHHVPVLALNPPRVLVRRVATLGLAQALTDPDMQRWGMQHEPLVDDPAYREKITAQLRRCHGGLSDQDYQRMYEASLFRDEGIAKTIADRLRRAQTGAEPVRKLIVSYTGGGHIQYRLPVPNRVQRRVGSARQITIYLTAYEPGRADEIRELLKESVADYVWLTPLSAHGSPRRCK